MDHAEGLSRVSTTAPAHDTNSAATAAEQRAHMADTASTSHGAVFSRSTGLPSRMGKATQELKTKVPECVKDEFAALAHALGLTESELLRSLILVRLYGLLGAEMLHANQLRAAAGIGPEWAPKAEASL